MIKISSPSIDKSEIDAVSRVLKSKWLVEGTVTKRFEDKVAEFVGVKHAIAVNSGTAALHVALLAIGVKKGDAVIIPALTFPATANVVELVGAELIFVDVDARTFNIDPKQFLNKMEEMKKKGRSDKIKAIIPVHLAGQSAEMDEIIKIAKEFGLKVIEDAACALGAEYMGKKCGAMGDLGCFSFHPRKVITTGEGGMVVTNSDSFAENVRMFKNHGIKADGNKKIFVEAGLNYRMTDMNAALGIVQMKKINKLIRENIKRADIYNNSFRDVDKLKTPLVVKGNKHIYQTYSLILDADVNRDRMIEMLKDEGIETNFLTYALHVQPYYKEKYGFRGESYPQSLMIYERSLALPFHESVGSKEIGIISKTIKNILCWKKTEK